MRLKPLFYVYLSFLILSPLVRPTAPRPHRFNPPPVWAQWTYYELRNRHNHLGLASFHTAATTGQKIKLPSRMKKIFRLFNLEHLMTPSGLHLSLLTSFFFPFISRRKRVAFLSPFLFLSNFPSLKRIALLKIFRLLKPNLSLWHAFIIVSIIDYLIGSRLNSPLSFLYGFLFLGSVIATLTNRTFSSTFLPFSLLGAQMLLAYTTGQMLYPGGYFIGLALTSLFAFIFPLMLLDIFLIHVPHWPLFCLSHYPLKAWWHLLLWCAPMARSMGSYEVSIFAAIAILAIPLRYYKTAGLLFLLNTTTLWNAPHPKNWRTSVERPLHPLKMIKVKDGYISLHAKKRRCHHRHRPIGYEIKCNY